MAPGSSFTDQNVALTDHASQITPRRSAVAKAKRRRWRIAQLGTMLGAQTAHQFDEARHARRAQRVIVDLMAFANPFERIHRIVIDAVDRKHDDIRTW